MRAFRHMKGLWVIAMIAALAFSVSLTTAVAGDKTAADLVNEAKEKVCEISVAEAKEKIVSGAPLFILDVREPDEFNKGHIPKAMNAGDRFGIKLNKPSLRLRRANIRMPEINTSAPIEPTSMLLILR